MNEPIHYLEGIKSKLRLNSSQERDILRELYTHLEERIQELEEEGLSKEEATKTAIQSFGSDEAVARQMNLTHGSGSWREAFWAATPHILFAFLFAARLWENAAWLFIILGLILGISIYGWCHSKPVWLFPWLGYSLLPVLLVGLFFLSVIGQSLSRSPEGLGANWWAVVALLFYFPLALWLIISIAIQTIRRDWILSSLATLPLPALLGWFLAVQGEGANLEYSKQHLSQLSPSIALSLLTLAAIVALFVRIHQRFLKTGALLSAGFLILAILTRSTGENLAPATLVLLILATLVLLLAPAVLERKVGHQEVIIQDWDYVLLQPSLKSKP